MVVFDWEAPNYEKETCLQKILYYIINLIKSRVDCQSSLLAIKAWVGGADYRHFKYDYASNQKVKVG